MKKETNTRREGHLSKTVDKKNPNTVYGKKCFRKMKKKFRSPTYLGGFYQFNFFPLHRKFDCCFLNGFLESEQPDLPASLTSVIVVPGVS